MSDFDFDFFIRQMRFLPVRRRSGARMAADKRRFSIVNLQGFICSFLSHLCFPPLPNWTHQGV